MQICLGCAQASKAFVSVDSDNKDYMLSRFSQRRTNYVTSADVGVQFGFDETDTFDVVKFNRPTGQDQGGS